MGIRAGTGEYLSWTILRDDPSTFPSHGNNSGAHGEPYSKHNVHFFLIVGLAEMEVASSDSVSLVRAAPDFEGF